MYCEFYQLSERPFNVTPDPKFLYLNARYREAIASLNYGITQRKGFITLIGEAGTGKTTLLNKLLEELDPKTKSVFIFNTNVTFEEILEYIFAEFDLPVHNGKKLYMLQRLNAFLLEELRNGGNVALLIDEAQDLEFSVLEDLRLLSNLETAKEKILQIVLSGQPELGQKLSNPILRQLRQRIGINCRLLPLSRDEITEYIQYRLQAAGCPDLKLFSREAEDQIYHFSRGIPRLVNVVCDNALVIGYALGKKRIGADIVTEAAADLLSVEPNAPERPPAAAPIIAAPPAVTADPQSRWRSRLAVMGLVGIALVVGLLSVGRTILTRHGREPRPVTSAPKAQPLEVIRPGSQPEGAGVELPVARPNESDELAAVGREDRRRPDVAAPVDKAPAADDEMRARAEGSAARPAGAAPAVLNEPASLPPQRASAGDEHPAVPEVAVVPEHRAIAANVPAPPPPPAPKPADADVEPAAAVAKADAGDTMANAWQRDLDLRKSAPRTQPVSDEPRHIAESARTETRNPRLDGMQFASVLVRGGDSMSGIALRKYGQASYTILDLLKLANPELSDIDVISVGQTIRLPELGEGFPILNEGTGRYSLLVFSTPHAPRASALQSALRSRGFDARVAGGSIGAQKPTFRVLVSGFTDRDEVASVSKQLQKLLREDARIAQLGE